MGQTPSKIVRSVIGLAAAAAFLSCFAVILDSSFTEPPTPSLDLPAVAVARSEPAPTTRLPATLVQTQEAAKPVAEPLDIAPSRIVQSEAATSLPAATSKLRAVADPPVSFASAQPQETRAAIVPEPPTRPIEIASKLTVGFVGVWGADASACSPGPNRKGLLPAVVDEKGAWAGETTCAFTNRQQVSADAWTVTAACSSARDRWTTKVRLAVAGDRLTWSSQRGTQRYVRCVRGPVMEASR